MLEMKMTLNILGTWQSWNTYFENMPMKSKYRKSDVDEFEAYETTESKFAHAMDNLQFLLLNDNNGGRAEKT